MSVVNIREVYPGVSLGLWQMDETVEQLFESYPHLQAYRSHYSLAVGGWPLRQTQTIRIAGLHEVDVILVEDVADHICGQRTLRAAPQPGHRPRKASEWISDQ